MRADNQCFKVITAGEVPEIYLYDVIGDDDFFGGVSDKQFAAELVKLKGAKQIDVRVNSPGGDAFQAYAMFNLLRNHKAHIRMFVDGLAASAASFIIMAGDEIEMADNARIMIHEARGGIWGTAGDMRKRAQLIDSLNADILNIYVSRSGGDADDLKQLMAAETYFTASEALDRKLVDRVGGEMKVAACLDPDMAKRLGFTNVPSELFAQAQAEPELTPENAMRRRIATLKK